MNILFITKLLPYPIDAGGKYKTFQIIKLISRNNKINFVSFVDVKKDYRFKSRIKNYCSSVNLIHLPVVNARHRLLIFKFIISLIKFAPFTFYKYY